LVEENEKNSGRCKRGEEIYMNHLNNQKTMGIKP
jgi:hypothetical protein